MHEIKTGKYAAVFHTTFKIPSHSNPTRFSSLNYSKPKTRLRKSRFWISKPSTVIRNKFAANTDKELESSSPEFNLTTRDSYFTIPVEVFTNHILAKKTYFTNRIE